MMSLELKDIQIIGCRGSVDSVDELLKSAREFTGGAKVLLQFLDAERVLGREHVISAVEHALRAFSRKRNISDSLAMEILLYTAGEPQISIALQKVGIKDGCEGIALVADGALDIAGLLAHLNLSRDDEVLAFSESKLVFFGIEEDEIKAVDEQRVRDLILERVAMLDVKR